MTKRSNAPRQRALTRPDAPAATGAIVGIVGEAAGTRSGEDTRRRGWFWHWNSIVTQFAPLIGLKGIGLLNSYTVWTDRREESPHRGYAFPSQQREADFYGEDRAELITINKILVALDLIEIRKEMVVRADEQGRRWRVPHNFYRVKDHEDGFTLTTPSVMRVVELADQDEAVYRYIRHIFSARFAPIDADNVWVQILEEVRQTEVWQRLAARAAREEERASARSRAGHASRKSGSRAPSARDMATTRQPSNDSVTVTSRREGQTSVAKTNTGLEADVATSNKGSTGPETTDVPESNDARASDVGPSNTTYHQSVLTTTTSDRLTQTSRTISPVAMEPGRTDPEITAPQGSADQAPALTRVHGGHGPGGQTAPDDVVGEATAIRAFEDANARRSTPAERHLLRGLAERFDPPARAQAIPGRETGWAWVTAAIYEAVEAGSAFVAPRRLREILARWEREGIAERPSRRAASEESAAPRAGAVEAAAGISLGEGPDLPLPHGFGSQRTWEFTVGLLAATIGREALAGLVAGTAIIGYRDGEVVLGVPSQEQAERIAGEYRELIARKLGEAMRRPIRLAVQTVVSPTKASARPAAGSEANSSVAEEVSAEEVTPEPFVVAECGLLSSQVWAAVLEEVAMRGSVGRADFEAWLRTTTLLGRGEDGSLIVGVPHLVAQRRVTGRYLPALRAAAAAVIGEECPIEVVVARDWLLERVAAGRVTPPSAGTGRRKRA